MTTAHPLGLRLRLRLRPVHAPIAMPIPSPEFIIQCHANATKMLSDQARLLVLAAALVGCLVTLFTSHSAYTSGGVGTLQPQQQRYCKKPREEARRCLVGHGDADADALARTRWRLAAFMPLKNLFNGDDISASGDGDSNDNKSGDGDSSHNKSCSALLKQVTKCEGAVFKAYRQINLSGCVREIQARAICESEWCDGQSNEGCNKECKVVRDNLSKCQQRYVEQSFHKSGLLSDGTFP